MVTARFPKILAPAYMRSSKERKAKYDDEDCPGIGVQRAACACLSLLSPLDVCEKSRTGDRQTDFRCKPATAFLRRGLEAAARSNFLWEKVEGRGLTRPIADPVLLVDIRREI